MIISRIRNSVAVRFFWGLMGAYLLNIGVDAADPFPEYIPEDLSFNDQESIIEIIIEKVLGFEDAIEEYDDRDTEKHNKKRIIQLQLILPLFFNMNAVQAVDLKQQRFPEVKLYLTEGFYQIDPPPPKS